MSQTGEVKKMSAVLNNDGEYRDVIKEGYTHRFDASFTEVYELIFYNKTMVHSEWEVLLKLVQKKIAEKVPTASVAAESDTIAVYSTQATTAWIKSYGFM